MVANKNKDSISPFYAWLGLIVTFVFALFFMLATFVPSSQSALNDNISGWGWSPLLSGTLGSFTGSGFGLTSFNDCYCFYPQASAGYICRVNIDQPCVSDKGLGYAPYGLRVDLQTREITGWVWSQGAGWICFGQSCCNAGGGQNYCGDWKGDVWEPTNPNITVTYPADQDPAPISGWAKIVGWNGMGDISWISLRGITTNDGSEYGLRFSTSTLEIRGLGWGAIGYENWYHRDTPLDGALPYAGYGWLCINEEYNGPPNPVFTNRGLCPSTGVQIAVPYIQTVDGDVYSQTNIAPDINSPAGTYNATYLIMAGGNIQNFSSEERDSTFGSGEYIMPNFPYSISLPKSNTNFFNVFGYLDIPGISENKTNKYGPVNYISGNYSINGDISWPNTRYIIDNGDLTIGSISGDPGTTRYTRGNTTFVVDGDLYIVKNITYSQDPVTKFTDLPSVAYIVRGDVYISPGVTEIAGNFIVLGADGVNCDAAHCGTIYTGASEDNTLKVNGIMMAKKFVFQRTYATVLKEPAEQVIYDGRLLINTPPGLQDFAKGLPIWSEVAPK